MPKFIVFDHSLCGPDGHHLNYAVEVIRAAEQLGHVPMLAAHRRFRDTWLPGNCPVARVFSADAYRTRSIVAAQLAAQLASQNAAQNASQDASQDASANAANGTPTGGDTWRRRIQRARLASAERRQIARFRNGCLEALRRIPLEEGDQVFLPTACESDLEGLTEALALQPATSRATWHVQFHFDLLEGRAEESPFAEAARRAAKSRIEAALARVPAHRIRCYCPTRALARQYGRLGAANFEFLPYLVGREFQPSATSEMPSRFRLTCAGYPRREKGRHNLNQLFRGLWDAGLSSGRLELAVQCKLPHYRRMVNGVAAAAAARSAAVLRLATGLTREQYVALIGQTDIAIFLYDPQRYRRRCSGVLLEMLSSGVPVIVPADSWLSEQTSPAAGRVFRDVAEIPELVLEMAANYGQFQSAAHRVATEMRTAHRAEATLLQLLAAPSDSPRTFRLSAKQPEQRASSQETPLARPQRLVKWQQG